MGQQTLFHGMLELTRPMTDPELAWIERLTDVGHDWTEEVSEEIWNRAKAEQTARGGGPTMIDGRSGGELSAEMRGLITGEGLSAGYAGDLRISDDQRGLVYASEKTYDMVAGINFIIVNARTKIPDFGLKGMFAADTEFAPSLWFIKINSDGMAYGEKTTRDEFLAFRRKLYPHGYRGLGLIDREEREKFEATRAAEQVPIDPPIPANGRDGAIWRNGHEQGWNDALAELTRRPIRTALAHRMRKLFRRDPA